MKWLDQIKWDAQGLVPVIAQEASTGDVLMFAWMNREALEKTVELKRAVYFSRSRNKLWFKGEESGHVQSVHDIRLDCDNDGPSQLFLPTVSKWRMDSHRTGLERPRNYLQVSTCCQNHEFNRCLGPLSGRD